MLFTLCWRDVVGLKKFLKMNSNGTSIFYDLIRSVYVILNLLCCSKSRRGLSGMYEKDEKLTEKEKELMEKDAEVRCVLYSRLYFFTLCRQVEYDLWWLITLLPCAVKSSTTAGDLLPCYLVPSSRVRPPVTSIIHLLQWHMSSSSFIRLYNVDRIIVWTSSSHLILGLPLSLLLCPYQAW